MIKNDEETETLLKAAVDGHYDSTQALLNLHRDRLIRVVARRLDRRVVSRIDPSDVVQDVLTIVGARLPSYARNPSVPFYPWLLQIARERVIQVHRFHLGAGRRSVLREEVNGVGPPTELSHQVVDSAVGPSERLEWDERRQRILKLFDQLSSRDREVLELHYLQELTFAEIAQDLKLTEGAVKMRHLRALERVRALMEGQEMEDLI